MSSRGQPGDDTRRGSRGGGPPGRGGSNRGSSFRGGPSRGGPFVREGFRGGPPPSSAGGLIFSENNPAVLPSRLTDTSQTELINSFKSLKVTAGRPLRPGYGTAGTPITLRANFFPIRIQKGPIYEYTISITPDVKGGERRHVLELMEESPTCTPHLPYIAHDRSQRLVSARKLPQPLDIQVHLPNAKANPHIVSIAFLRELQTSKLTEYLSGKPGALDYDPAPHISALDLVLRQHATRHAVQLGKNKDRHFFLASAQKIQLGPWVEACRGFFMSARPTFKELMVNVNVCMAAFVSPGNLADALLAFSRGSKGAMPTLPPGFAKIKVQTRHLGYKKIVHSMGVTSARNTLFDSAEYGKVSVEQYFMKKYNIRLKYPTDLPVANLSAGKNKPSWVPAELCDILPGHPYATADDKEASQKMIRYASIPPRANAETIVNQGFPMLGLSPSNQLPPPLNAFGISINPEMAAIPARELRPPRLTYKSGSPRVNDGSWNIVDVTFHRGAQVSSYWVLVVRDGADLLHGSDDMRLRNLVKGFANKCQRCGMTIPQGPPNLIAVHLPKIGGDPGRVGAIEVIRSRLKGELASKKKPSFIIVLLENRDNFIYPAIKRIGDVELGIHTIHMQLVKALDDRKQDQYFSNIALKINTKLGGINHLLDNEAMKWLTQKKTMLVGVDVTHPGLNSRDGSPSIAAMVASIDNYFVHFPATLRLQDGTKEMVSDLGEMMVEHLQAYEKKNSDLPERIFVFRDGVSEGQFDTVVGEELPQLIKAFKKFETKRRGEYRPTISIVICGKRHHARFYPVTSNFASRNGNTRPGTVVDKGVTAVFDFDFYLQAHAGLQGTVKPTHYTVVYDENAFSADTIQQGTHSFSHLYARATKAVSLIPPAYYADLACERGRYYLNEIMANGPQRVPGGMKKLKTLGEEEKKQALRVAQTAWGSGLHDDLKGTMFYI